MLGAHVNGKTQKKEKEGLEHNDLLIADTQSRKNDLDLA